MSRISRDEEARLAAEFELEADRDEQWEAVPAPVQRGRRTLGTQITIRLDDTAAEQLRQIARDRGIGYTSLLRRWIEERLSSESNVIPAEKYRITYAGAGLGRYAVQSSGEGEVKLVPLGAA
jgi:predicted DNA binding CopG/RHH family protein